jgi:two-component system, NarL family, response regulator NreC
MKTMRRKLQVLLVDEEGMLRDGLCAMINQEEGLAVAGVIAGTPALLSVSLPADPDILIVDFGAPGVSPRETVELARRRWPNVPILVLTFSRDEDAIEAALRLGADGYLLKTDRRDELLNAIRSVIAHKRYISPTVFDTVVSGFVSQQSQVKQTEADNLSDREREVMRLIAQGLRTREIADRLSVSHKTVEKHRTNLMRKLGLRTAGAVAAYAISHGYLPTQNG